MNVLEFKRRYRFVDSFHTYPGKNGAVFDIHELEYMKLCFVFRLYWIGSMKEHATGLLDCYEKVWPVIAPHVTSYRDNKKRKNPAKAGKNTGDILRVWLQEPESAPKMMVLLNLYNKIYDCEGADVRLNFKGLDFRGGGSMELYLPAEWLEEDAAKYSSWCADLASCFEFCSGIAGYGLTYGDSEGETMAKRELYALGRRHPGIDVRSEFSNHLGQGIKGANWLTFLHGNFVSRLGGREKLGVALCQPGVKIVDLPSGVMIQAGEAPVIGDTNAQVVCPHYQQVGRVLAPIRDRDYPQLMMDPQYGVIGSTEHTEEWLSRFD